MNVQSILYIWSDLRFDIGHNGQVFKHRNRPLPNQASAASWKPIRAAHTDFGIGGRHAPPPKEGGPNRIQKIASFYIIKIWTQVSNKNFSLSSKWSHCMFGTIIGNYKDNFDMARTAADK